MASGFKFVREIGFLLGLFRDGQYHEFATPWDKQLWYSELLRVLLDQLRGQRGEVLVAQADHQERTGHNVVEVSGIVPQATVQVHARQLSLVIADQGHSLSYRPST